MASVRYRHDDGRVNTYASVQPQLERSETWTRIDDTPEPEPEPVEDDVDTVQ